MPKTTRRKQSALRLAGAGAAICAAPYVILPPVCSVLPEGIVWGIAFILCYLMLPLSAMIAPYMLSRRGLPAIAAWPWPVLGVLILPLWGMQPQTASCVIGTLVALVSAVAGEEMRRRETGAREETSPRRNRKRRR